MTVESGQSPFAPGTGPTVRSTTSPPATNHSATQLIKARQTAQGDNKAWASDRRWEATFAHVRRLEELVARRQRLHASTATPYAAGTA
jgi:hypothetical protein